MLEHIRNVMQNKQTDIFVITTKLSQDEKELLDKHAIWGFDSIEYNPETGEIIIEVETVHGM